MEKSVQNNLKKHIKQGDTIILGVSGGPDSIYLLHQCLNLQIQLPFEIIIAHINHNQRGEDSNTDQTFVHNLAKKHHYSFESITITKNLKGNMEEQFRNIRYDFFEELRKQYKASWILTAHHLNDNIETVLLNLVRGSFLDGLAGMTVVDGQRHLLRPLLFTTKDQILEFLTKHKLKYRIDKTNDDTNLSRNLIRHKVIPPLKKINSNLEQTIANNIPNLQKLQTYLEKHTKEWIENNSSQNGIKNEAFRELDPIMQKNVLFELYRDKYGNNNLSRNHLEQILKIIYQNYANRKKEFGKDYLITINKPKNASERYIQILKK